MSEQNTAKPATATTMSAAIVVPSLLAIGGLLVLCAVWPQQADRQCRSRVLR